MNADFSKCMPVILAYEGGWSNHPRDPGGVTLEGIIQRVYDGYRNRRGLPLKKLVPAMRGTADWQRERNDIYRLQYWNAVRGDELPEGVDLLMFDCAVNSGPYQAIKWLQRALGFTDCDGHLGEGVLSRLQSHPDRDALIADICARRLGMLKQLKTWNDFGKGWSARIANVKHIAQSWAQNPSQKESVGPQPIAAHAIKGDAKAYASDVAQPAVDPNDAIKAGVGSGSIGAVLNSAKDTIEPVAYSSDWMMKVYTGITILCVIAGLGAILYSVWAHHKARKASRAIDGDIMVDVPEGQPA